MKFLLRLCGLLLVLACLPATAQISSLKISKIEIKHIGPQSVSDDLIRANIRIKPGDPYLRAAVDEDIRTLYGTGQFYDIRVTDASTADGVTLTYVLQGNPRLIAIKFQGNKKYKDPKLLKKVTSKIGDPLNERKLFTDSQEMQKMYQKAGYPSTTVKYSISIEESTGRATATFDITESPKVKITRIEFVNAQAFTQKQLRKVIKTRQHWMFS
jgi:outer membrane protein insertion porin family